MRIFGDLRQQLSLRDSERLRYGLYLLLGAGLGLALGVIAERIWDNTPLSAPVEAYASQHIGEMLAVILFFLPTLFVVGVWWSWCRDQEGKQWRRLATLSSVMATTISLIVSLGLQLWQQVAAAPIIQTHRAFYLDLVNVGFLLCIASMAAAIMGRGHYRWLMIPAAIFQGYHWILAWAIGHATIGV